MLDKGNAKGVLRSEGAIESCGLQPPIPFSSIIRAASKRAADRMRNYQCRLQVGAAKAHGLNLMLGTDHLPS